MSSTRLRDRIFAGFGALLFLVTASAFTIGVVVDMVQKKDAPTQTTAQDTPQKEEILPVPEVYKPEGDVTELQTTDLTEGTVFDENYTKDTAYTLKLGNGEVISEWDQGLVGMKAGGVRRLVIPSDLAYGEAGRGSIPANADLVFAVKLVRIQK